MPVGQLQINTNWFRPEDKFVIRIENIEGGSMPTDVRNTIKNTFEMHLAPASSPYFAMAQPIVNYVGAHLPEPEPIDIGGTQPLTGKISRIQYVERRQRELNVLYYITYTNGHERTMNHIFDVNQLPESIQALLRGLKAECDDRMKENVWERFGKGGIDPAKWKPKKLGVFISYRPRDGDIARALFDALGNYNEASTFLPRIDVIDLSAGNWMNQLMSLIRDCEVFLPVLSREYLSGPVARQELDQALRANFYDNKRIVPLLIENTPADYGKHFLGGFQMVDAVNGLNPGVIDTLAHMILGASRNRFA